MAKLEALHRDIPVIGCDCDGCAAIPDPVVVAVSADEWAGRAQTPTPTPAPTYSTGSKADDGHIHSRASKAGAVTRPDGQTLPLWHCHICGTDWAKA